MKPKVPNDPVIVEYRSTYYPHILFALLVWSLAMTWDYHEQAEVERQSADQARREFTACQRGEWRAVTEQGHEIGCMPVQSFDPKTQKTTKGW